MRFSEIYSQGRPVFSFEFFPPKKVEDIDSAKENIRRLARLTPDFMTVTYGAGGGTRALTGELVSFIAHELNFPAVAHLTCVHHTVQEIDAILMSLHNSDIGHILALRGDSVHGEPVTPEDLPGFSCARDLIRYLAAKWNFSIACAGYPETHPQATSQLADMSYLAEKTQMGAEIVITQVFFDAGIYFDFVRRARAAGISAPIVPGIMPISNVGQIERFTAKCSASIPQKIREDLKRIEDDSRDVLEYGIRSAQSLCRELLDGGAPGIHFFTLNKPMQVEEIVRFLKEPAKL